MLQKSSLSAKGGAILGRCLEHGPLVVEQIAKWPILQVEVGHFQEVEEL